MIFGECCRKVALESTVSYVRNYKKCKLDSLLSILVMHLGKLCTPLMKLTISGLSGKICS